MGKISEEDRNGGGVCQGYVLSHASLLTSGYFSTGGYSGGVVESIYG